MKLTLATFITCILFACSKTVKPNLAYYYWKSENFKGNSELIQLQKTKTHKCYIKFFEIIPNGQNLIPGDVSDFKTNDSIKSQLALSKTFENIEIVPTVFISNDCFKVNNINYSLAEYSDKILKLISNMYNEYHGKSDTIKEIQIDCDWTPKTKESYFKLLGIIKEKSRKKISCTLRLYPFKYQKTMGIPPVDRCILMCYNLISPRGNESKNSILDNAELELYLKNSVDYPIPLDVALPLFSWYHIYKNDQFSGLLPANTKMASLDLQKTKHKFWYLAKREATYGDKFIRKGDLIKYESVNEKELTKCIELLNKYINFKDNYTVAFYHLDPLTSEQFNPKIIMTLVDKFNSVKSEK